MLKFFLQKITLIYKKFTSNFVLVIISFCIVINIFILEVVFYGNELVGKILINNTYNLHKETNLPLLTNCPNPFTSFTYIYVRLPQKDNCEIKIFDILGNLLTSYILEGQQEYIVKWHPEKTSLRMSTGGYICVLNYRNFKIVRKIGYISKK